MTYYVKVSYYDEPSDLEEYDSRDEAGDAYSHSLELADHRVMGDVAGISYGKHLPNGKREVFASRSYS